jgi:hypothetical protein
MRKITHNLSNILTPPAVGVQRRRPVLDISLGWSLLKDDRMPAADKLRAAGVGALAAAAVAALDVVLFHVLRLPGHPYGLLMHGLFFGAIAAIFTSLNAVRLASEGLVTRLRYERFPVIPIRPRTCEPQHANGSSGAGAPSPRYAVIPRRMR